MPQRTVAHDDVTVIGCPALAKLGGDVATGASLAFPRKAKASFTYAGGSSSELTEELYSDTEDKISRSVGRIFEAMTSGDPDAADLAARDHIRKLRIRLSQAVAPGPSESAEPGRVRPVD